MVRNESSVDRIEKAFFSSGRAETNSRPAPKSLKKKLNKTTGKLSAGLWLIGVPLILILIISLLLFSGSLYIIPPLPVLLKNIPAEIQGPVHFPSRRAIIALPALDKVTVTVVPKTYLDLQNNTLWLPLRSPEDTVSGFLTARDTQFHSNALEPIAFRVPVQGRIQKGILFDLPGLLKEPVLDMRKIAQLRIMFNNSGSNKALVIMDKRVSLIKK